ncbi:MAG: hypothetical protein U9R19_10890 [Bacteroidota bacterium]|nr:hypothetical protein [Bacteroidota bacterium]
MAKSSGVKNAPSTTGKPSGGGRGNNPARTSGGGSKGASKGGKK